MAFAVLTGRSGEKAMTFKPYNEYLRNRVWKLIPIYEGKDKDGNVVCDEIEALIRFKKNLNRILTEIDGAYENSENPRYFELMNILKGLENYGCGKHDEMRDIVFYCCDILNDLEVDNFV